jgi:hypothetical protein
MISPDILETLARLGPSTGGLAERVGRLRRLLSDLATNGSTPSVLATEQIVETLGLSSEAVPMVRAELNSCVSDGDSLSPDWLTLLLFRLASLEATVERLVNDLASLRDSGRDTSPTEFTIHSTAAN